MALILLEDTGLFSADVEVTVDGQILIDWSNYPNATPYESLNSIDVYRNGVLLMISTYTTGAAVEGGFLSVTYTDELILKAGDVIGIRYKPTFVNIDDSTLTTYHTSVRRILGVSSSVISNEDIDDDMIMGMAEVWISRKVPTYASITDRSDALLAKSALLNYAASLLCPTCALKNKIEVKTIDTSWKKDKVNWDKRAADLEGIAMSRLLDITTVEVVTGTEGSIFNIAHTRRYLDGEY